MPTHMPRVGRFPITPPEIWGPCANSAGGYSSTGPGFYPTSMNDPHYGMESHDKYGYDKYGYGKPAPITVEQYPELPHSYVPSHNSSHARHDYGYGAIGAPILPPLRIQGSSMDKQAQRQSVSHNPVREQPKEEKVAGGVAAHLDYEIEQMIDFVAESAQGMYDLFEARFCLADIDISRSIQPSSTVTPEFRKYVSQILTSTRLPSSTILLALHYLAQRLSMLQDRGVYTSSTGHLYHMLTVGLMLASKFLDDNTFQNRSWAEVSHIAVTELNKQEREWLADIKWVLHFDVNDQLGFAAWIKQWDHYRAKKVELSMEALKLSPVDPVRMQYPAPKYGPQTPMYTPPYTETSFSSVVRDRNQSLSQQWPPIRTLSPPAVHSGSATPEWYKHSMMGFNQHSMAYSSRPLPPLQILPSNNSPFYGGYPQQQFTPSPWNCHGPGCGCGYCNISHGHERYMLPAGYAMQPVAG